MGPAPHVNEITVGGRALAATHGAKPGVVEMANGFAEELFVEGDDLGAVNHAFYGGIVTSGFAVEIAGSVGMGDAFDAGVGWIEQAFLGESITDRGTGFHDQGGIKEAGEIEVTVVLEAPVEFFGLIKVIGGAAHMTKGIGGGV